MKATISQLEYIIALDTYRHFGKAAGNCFITQPTLSMQINKLEDNLGVKIFDRSRQPVVPTELGSLILEQARRVVNEAKKMEEIIEDQKKEVSGALKIGVIPTIAPYLLPLFAKSFMNKYPSINIQVQELLTEDTLAAIKSEAIDVGIVVGPLNDSSFREIPIYYEKFLGYAHNTNLEPPEEPISGKDLENNELWLLNEGHCFREQVLNICQNRNFDNILNYQSGSLEALKRMVDKQGGVTLLPELATLDLSPNDSKKLRTFKKPTPFREVSLVMKRDFLKRRIIEALQKEIVDHLPDIMKQREENEIQVINWR
ncbi:transcriptional regulator [Marivirga tractuosa]|uniref:Transcriptional regulator, LysR family n=1 Tax=Marivirga tractuosa (strain ATCC 23168 / DSM 4126 / NBRC 15989 / NCIMB 1408 / VKM B-1430 / H-43) TaxID=643867 RepID=E4TQV1_MARTH|nr:LysR substrate-binding domain-containing protein [Marivirga tractuosa]ADR21651.1 transcriptional regulator, LysR family [Marivirga tractuosa DSM 4126]BDD13892.1 transcriptional regulator [Marivirga tractuosa]